MAMTPQTLSVRVGDQFSISAPFLPTRTCMVCSVPEVIDWLTPRFEDVSKIHPFHNFVERLAELEVAGGCSQEPGQILPG